MAGEEQGEGAEGGGGEEVVFVEEVKVGEGELDRRRDTREEGSSEARGGHTMASADFRYKEVKVEMM